MTASAPAAEKRPAGYGHVVPFDTKRHAGFGVTTKTGFSWCAKLNAVPLAAAEFFRAALDYPIAFAPSLEGGLVPMAILGVRSGENLFVYSDGAWRPRCYLPAYVRRFPFCLAQAANVSDSTRHIICVQEDQLDQQAKQLLVDHDGKTTAAWEPVRQLIETMEAAWQQTRLLCERLEKLGLLVPFEAVTVPSAGGRTQLRGLYRIDEAKLTGLPLKDVRAMISSGEMRALYAHMLSLENFGRLLDLAQERNASNGH